MDELKMNLKKISNDLLGIIKESKEKIRKIASQFIQNGSVRQS